MFPGPAACIRADSRARKGLHYAFAVDGFHFGAQLRCIYFGQPQLRRRNQWNRGFEISSCVFVALISGEEITIADPDDFLVGLCTSGHSSWLPSCRRGRQGNDDGYFRSLIFIKRVGESCGLQVRE
jgi:hypothetical protein